MCAPYAWHDGAGAGDAVVLPARRAPVGEWREVRLQLGRQRTAPFDHHGTAVQHNCTVWWAQLRVR